MNDYEMTIKKTGANEQRDEYLLKLVTGMVKKVCNEKFTVTDNNTEWLVEVVCSADAYDRFKSLMKNLYPKTLTYVKYRTVSAEE